MKLTGEYWRGSSGRDGHHEQVFSLRLHHYEVLIVPQGVWSEAHCVLATHPWGNDTTLPRESPCQNISEYQSLLTSFYPRNSLHSLVCSSYTLVFCTVGGAAVHIQDCNSNTGKPPNAFQRFYLFQWCYLTLWHSFLIQSLTLDTLVRKQYNPIRIKGRAHPGQ